MPLNLTIILLTICTLILIILLSRYVFSGSKFLFSPMVIGVAYYLLRAYPGTIDASYQLLSYKPLLGTLISFLGMLTGLTFISMFPKRHIYKRNDYYEYSQLLIIKSIILIGVLSVIFTFIMFGNVPFLYLIQDLLGNGSDVSMHEARRMNTLEHRAGNTTYFGQGYLKFIYLTIAPLFISVLYVLKRLNNQNLKPVKYLMFIFCVFGGLNGQVWPIINLLLIFALTIYSYPYIFDSNITSKKSPRFLVMKGLKLMLTIIALIFLYRYAQMLSGREFENFFLDTFRRIYSNDAAKLYILFPDQEPFRYGTTWLNDILGFLPGSSQSFSYEVHYLVHGGGWGFTLAPGLFASAYVNFGYTGNFFLFFIITVIYAPVFIKLMSSNVIEYKILSLYISLTFAIALSADITSIILPFFILIAFTLLITLQRTIKQLNRRMFHI